MNDTDHYIDGFRWKRDNRCGRCGQTGHNAARCDLPATSVPEHLVCIDCGAKRHEGSKRCRPCMLEHRRRKPKPCPFCAREFTPNDSKQKYCSIECVHAAKELPSSGGTIYALIENGHGDAVKIGHTSRDIIERMRGLQTGNRRRLICIA